MSIFYSWRSSIYTVIARLLTIVITWVVVATGLPLSTSIRHSCILINPQRACARRVTVVILSVCHSFIQQRISKMGSETM